MRKITIMIVIVLSMMYVGCDEPLDYSQKEQNKTLASIISDLNLSDADAKKARDAINDSITKNGKDIKDNDIGLKKILFDLEKTLSKLGLSNDSIDEIKNLVKIVSTLEKEGIKLFYEELKKDRKVQEVKFHAAEKKFAEVVRIDPSRIKSYMYLAKIYGSDRGFDYELKEYNYVLTVADYKMAIGYWRAAFAIDDTNIEVLIEGAKMMIGLSKMPLAFDEISDGVSRDVKGLLKNAKLWLQRSIDLNPITRLNKASNLLDEIEKDTEQETDKGVSYYSSDEGNMEIDEGNKEVDEGIALYKIEMARDLETENRDFGKAMEKFVTAKKKNPKNAEAYFWISRIYITKSSRARVFKSSAYVMARQYLTDAVKYDSTNANYYNELAIVTFRILEEKKQGSYIKDTLEKALEYVDTAIELDNTNADYHYTRGSLHFYNKEYAKSIQDYDRAIDLDKYFGNAYLSRAIAQFELGKYLKALDDYDKAISLGSVDAHKIARTLIDEAAVEYKRKDENADKDKITRLVKKASEIFKDTKFADTMSIDLLYQAYGESLRNKPNKSFIIRYTKKAIVKKGGIAKTEYFIWDWITTCIGVAKSNELGILRPKN